MERLESAAHVQERKTALIHRMRKAARERTVTLQKMLLLSDPFDRDAEGMRLNDLAGDFVAAREEYLGMPMDRSEEALLARQGRLSGIAVPIQRQVADLILSGQDAAARQLLVEQAIPAQDRVFAVLNRMAALQHERTAQALAEAREDYRLARNRLLQLGALVAVICILIAVYVTRRGGYIEARLAAERRRARQTLDCIGEGVVATTWDGRIEQINPIAASLLGCSTESALGRQIGALLKRRGMDAGGENLVRDLNQVLAGVAPGPVRGSTRVAGPGRGGRVIEYNIAAIGPAQGRLAGAILVLRDVTEQTRMAEKLAWQARYDALTGLYNRVEFDNRLEAALAEVRRYPQTRAWLCYIDLDQFKVVNDTSGHAAGDEYLKQVGNLLRAQVRETDLVARLGGDEFAILLSHCDAREARNLAERARDAILGLRFAWGSRSYSCGASIGMVPVRADAGSAQDLLSAADTACYVAKDAGRNRVHVYRDDEDAGDRHREMQWVHRIHSALEEDRFTLAFQPIVPLQGEADGQHLEVLVRMHDRSGRQIPPMAFIPAAERYHLMSRVDRWVVGAVLESLRRRNPAPKTLVAVNISAQSLSDEGFLDYILSCLSQPGMDPRWLCLEVTETAAIANLSRARTLMGRLRELGCSLALDDFGTGLSSFGYLRDLAVDYVKIDGAFVRDLHANPLHLELVRAIHRIGRVAGIRTVAECIDNAETMAAVRDVGIDYGQGFWFARPRPLEEFWRDAERASARSDHL